jgi:hypothetical protein
MKLIEVIYLVLYILAALCFAAAAVRRPGPGATARWDLIGAGLLLVVLIRIFQLIDATN